jgi:hypothetical protein
LRYCNLNKFLDLLRKWNMCSSWHHSAPCTGSKIQTRLMHNCAR